MKRHLFIFCALVALAAAAPAYAKTRANPFGITVVRFAHGTSAAQMRSAVTAAGGDVVSDLSRADALAVAPSQFPTPFDFKLVSPVFPPPNGIQTGFNGDYSGLVINKGADAHPIWSDTRNVNPYPQNGVTHDEDVFTDTVGLPDGHGHRGQGHIGRALHNRR